MDELEEIVQRMIDAGESEDNIALVIKEYNSNKGSEPKKETAETINGDSNSVSAGTESSSESQSNNYRIPTEEELNTFTKNGGVIGDSEQVGEVEKARKEFEAQEKLKKKQQTDAFLKDITDRTKFPELMKEKDSILKEIESRPIVQDNSDLEGRLAEIDNIVNTEPKSFRKIRKERLAEIDAKMNELEQKDIRLNAKGGLIMSSGTYEALQEERRRVQEDIDGENQLLKKLTNDATITDQFIRFYTPKFLEKYVTPENEQVELDERVEEKILQQLDSDKRLKSQVSKGSMDRTYISLEKRENMIKSARQQVLVEEGTKIREQYDSIISKSKELDPEKDAKELFQLQNQIDKLNEKNDVLLFNSGYDKVTNQFNDVFKRTTKSKKYDESLGQGTADVGSTFVEGLTNVVLDGTVGFAGWLGSLGDGFTDDDSYSIFDAVGDTAYELSNNNLLPSSKSEEGRLVDKDGNWNVSLYSITKAGAEGLPFTIALINDARKGNVKNIYKKMGRIVSPKKMKTISQSLQMAEKAYKLTVSDNRKEAFDKGLDGIQAITYANFQSMGTGLSQMIMPDTKFFKTPAGKLVLNKFANDLKGAVTKQAIKKATVSFIGNMAKEIGEEEIEGAISEVIKFGMLQNHSQEFLTMKYQKELIGNTLAVTGILGGTGIKSNISATKTEVYKDLNTHYEGVMEQIDGMMESSTDEKFKNILQESKVLIADVKEATNNAPKNVTGKQIDLLIEKKKVLQEMKSKDDAFHPEYKEKIERLNEEIRKEASLKAEPTKDSKQTKTETKEGENKTEGKEVLKYNVSEQLKSHNENEGSTFTLDGKNRSGEKGVSSVSIFPERSKIIDGEITENDIAEFKEANKDILKGNEDVLAIGTWYDKKSGKTYLDVSAVTDTDSAVKLGKQYNQKAIFNLETFEEIDTKGDGTPIANLKSEKDRISDIRNILNESNKETSPNAKSDKNTRTNEEGANISVDENVQGSISEEKGIKPILAAVRAMVSVSKKKESLRDLKSKLKELTSNGLLTKVQSKSLINRALGVDATNKKQVDSFVDYFEKQMGKATSRNLKTVTNKNKITVKKHAKSKSKMTPQGLKNLAKSAGQIDEKLLDEKELSDYNEVLEEINASFLSVTNKKYKAVNKEKTTKKLEKLQESIDKKRKAKLEAELGDSSINMSDEDFERMVEEMKEDKRNKLKEKLINMAATRAGKLTGLSNIKRNFKLRNIDFNNFSEIFLKRYIKIVDNIVENNDDSGAYNLISEINKQKDVNDLLKKIPKDKVTNLLFDPINSVKGVSMMFKTIFGKSQLAAYFNHKSGLASISKNNQLMKNEISQIEDRYTKVLKVLKKKNKSIESAKNTLLRGVAGQLIQGSTEEDFKINKSRIEQHIERMGEYGGKDGVSLTNALKEVYADFKHFKSQQEVIDHLKSKADGNMELINFWLKTFDGLKERLRDNTEYVHGERMADFIDNYLPIKTKYDGSGDTTYEDAERGRPSFMHGGILSPKPTSSTLSRTKAPNLPASRILDLDFDNVMFNRLSKTLEDIHLSKDKKDISNFFKLLNKEKYFKAETRKILDKKINEMLDVYSNKPVMRSETEMFVKDAEAVIRKMSVRLALATITQYPKQYISVAIGSMLRLGKNADLMMTEMFTSNKGIPLLEMYSIHNRGDSQAGTKLTGDRISENKNGMYSQLSKVIGKKFKKIDEGIDKAIFYSLRTGDVNVARSSWIAFYKEYLRKNGVDLKTVDMMTEHELIDGDETRQLAASYAETMVEDTQISSDGARGSTFFNSNKNMAVTIIRSIMMPYQRFNVNGKVRMVTDVGNMVKAKKLGDKEMMKEASISLGATIAEQMTFHAMKIYLLSSLIGMSKTMIASMLGFESEDEDEETKEKNAAFKNKKFKSALAKDLNPFAVGSLLEDLSIEGWNWITYLASEDGQEAFDYHEWEKQRMKDDNLPMYRYGNQAGFVTDIGYGLYSAPFNKMGEVMDDFKYAFSDEPKVRNRYGQLETFDFDDDQRNLMKIMFLADLTSLIGNEMETVRVLQKIQREQLKEAKAKKKKKRR